jgi:hypothetical protein
MKYEMNKQALFQFHIVRSFVRDCQSRFISQPSKLKSHSLACLLDDGIQHLRTLQGSSCVMQGIVMFSE